MSGLLHRLQGTRRASIPSDPTDETTAVRATFRRSRSEPAKRRRSVESWLGKALPTSSNRVPAETEIAATVSSSPSSLRRRKRDFMRDAFIRVFVKHKSDRSHRHDVYYNASTPQSADPKWLAPAMLAPAPWEDEQTVVTSTSDADEDDASSFCDRPSCGFPPFLNDADSAGADGSDRSEDESETEAVEVREFVVPPVQVPASYRKQDRAGGTMVAGDVVLFTRLAFKRCLLLQRRRLMPIPEDCHFDAVRFATVCNYGGMRTDGVVVACFGI